MDEKIMLKVENLSVNYGHIEALKNVSVDVKKGQICSIIGARSVRLSGQMVQENLPYSKQSAGW